MQNFLIGLYGRFDEAKLRRNFRAGFWGVEACLFPNQEEADRLAQRAARDGFRFGVHYPLIQKNTPYRDPLLLSPDAEERAAAWASFEAEAALAAYLGAAYILVHFPKPVLADRTLDQKSWRFAGEKEWMFADAYPRQALTENLSALFARLSALSARL